LMFTAGIGFNDSTPGLLGIFREEFEDCRNFFPSCCDSERKKNCCQSLLSSRVNGECGGRSRDGGDCVWFLSSSNSNSSFS
jgi:hypothetical protein